MAIFAGRAGLSIVHLQTGREPEACSLGAITLFQQVSK
ncbi:hypothetical protein PATSB16_02920 [Pandoraea thiooxydans]|nr:hypothetical protein PATSB16_02920 [Pandoraea thiooxydans]